MIPAAIALLLLALVLVVAELFVPSHGLLALFAAIAAISSVILASKVSTQVAIVFTVLIFVAAPFVFYWAIRIYPNTPFGKRVLLDEPAPASTEAFKTEAAKLEELVGQQGVAMTTLRPAGSIEIAGRLIDALSDSEIIPPGAAVEVIRVAGMKVFVKAV